MNRTRPYVGYVDESDLPIKPGDRIAVPRGVLVASTNPRRQRWMTTRRHWIKVDHFLPGMSVHVRNLIHVERDEYPGFEGWFDLYDEIRDLRLKQPPGPKLDRIFKIECDFTLPLRPSQVRWAGEKGYWNAVTINALLGLPDDRVPPVSMAMDDAVEAILDEQG